MADCGRCTKRLQTGDEYAAETISLVKHLFYHWRCVRRDKTARDRLKKASGAWREHNYHTPVKEKTVMEVP